MTVLLAPEPPPPASRLAERLLEHRRRISSVEAELVVDVAQFHNSRLFELEGARTAGAWLAHHARLSSGDANRLVREATRLAAHPDLLAAVADIGVERARVIAAAVTRDLEEVFARDCQMLVGQARGLSVDEVRAAMARWVEVNRKEVEPRDTVGELHWAQLHNGPLETRLSLNDKADIEEFTATVDRIADRLFRAEANCDDATPTSTRAQLRAQALMQIIRGANTGTRPLVVAKMTLAELESRSGLTATLDRTGRLAPGEATRLCCEADVARIITDAESVPLDLGRSVRYATPEQRRAIEIHDGGCITPGCDIPAEWCDIHHTTSWDQHGESNIDTMCGTCRRHHVMHHQHKITITALGGGRFQVRRQDGTLMHPHPHT